MTSIFRRLFVAVTLCLTASPIMHAQSQQPIHYGRTKRLGPVKWEPKAQEIAASYWTLEPGWSTELEVRNNLFQRSVTVTPALRTAAGREILLSSLTLDSEQSIMIDLGKAVAQIDPSVPGQSGSFGSVAVKFDGLDGANVFAGGWRRRLRVPHPHPPSFGG